jgi:hypothetical protein
MKPLAIVLNCTGGASGGACGDHLTNVQPKAIWNCHNESPMNNEYILIKWEKKENNTEKNFRNFYDLNVSKLLCKCCIAI